MDGSELHKFREEWKDAIKRKQHCSIENQEVGTGDKFGEPVNGIKQNSSQRIENTSKTFGCEIYNPPHKLHCERNPEGTQIVVSKKRKNTPIGLLTLDIPSYQPQATLKNKHTDLGSGTLPVVNQASCYNEQDFISLLIRDIDETTTIPFFDVNLPKEVCVKIFNYLDVKDLCHCACVSKAWSALANDELIWYSIYRQLGFKKLLGKMASQQKDWKGLVRDSVVRQRSVKRNWQERICQIQTLEYEKGGALTACQIYKNLLVAGYGNGKTCLWDIDSDWKHSLEPSSDILEDPTKASVEFVSVVENICATAFTCGVINVWHTDISAKPIYQHRLPEPASHLLLASSKIPFLLTSCGSDIRVDQVQDEGRWGIVNSKRFENQITMVNLLPDDNETRFMIAMKEDLVTYNPRTNNVGDLDKIAGTKITAMTCSDEYIAVGWAPFGFGVGTEFTSKVRLYDSKTERYLESFTGHYGEITCLNLTFRGGLVTGSNDKRVRVYDIRIEQPQLSLRGHSTCITTVQMDSWKVVSGSFDGTLKVWDIRMGTVLWEARTTHPVRLCQFDENRLVTANIPLDKVPRESMWYADDLILHRRHRGSIQVYDFSSSGESGVVPKEMTSNYDNTTGYNYNINLVAPYDVITNEIN